MTWIILWGQQYLDAEDKRTLSFHFESGCRALRDAVHKFSEAEEVLKEADVFIVMGTSLQVSPVNTFPEYYSFYASKGRNNKECQMALINRKSTEKDDVFPVVYYEDIISAVKLLKKELLK